MNSKSNYIGQSYIGKVQLKGYKSLLSTEVELLPGLNIIIGPNGSGKTNFVEILDVALRRDFDEINYSDLEIRIDYSLDSQDSQSYILNTAFDKEDFERTRKYKIIEEFDKSLENLYPIVLIKYGYPNHIEGFDSEMSVEFSVRSGEVQHPTNLKTDIGFILYFFLQQFDWSTILTADGSVKNPDVFLQTNISSSLRSILNKFSNIGDVRLSPNKAVKGNRKDYTISLLNCRFEFLVNGQWYYWNQLSDGTKRIFYILTEIFCSDQGVFFIEEPELGIHPHQLARLMDFIKEQAEEKQIIITTHSPQVLNVLDKDDDLDRIIVTRYDKELGTTMTRLSPHEKKNALDYMYAESLFLSDYWLVSGFTEEETV